MLLQFTVENHKSIREPVTLSMVAAEHVEHPPGRTYDVPGVGKVLKVAAIYGPNASGKSNLLDAWSSLVRLVVRGVPAGERLPRDPFVLDGVFAQRPTRFVVTAWRDGRLWTYTLAFDDARVVEESLTADGAVVFVRRPGDGATPEVTWGEAATADARRLAFLGFLAEGTRQEQPLLAESVQRNVPELAPVYALFMRGYLSLGAGLALTEATGGAIDFAGFWHDAPLRDRLLVLLQELDTGVDGIELYTRDAQLLRALAAHDPIDVPIFVAAARRGTPALLKFRHGAALLDFEQLSSGTQRLVQLFMNLDRGWLGEGNLFTVDELDQSFHTQLTQRLVAYAQDCCANGGQLLFTTHDTNLLDVDLLGADGIWFTQKDADGATRLYSLAEFDPEELAELTGSLEQGYLDGRFGAIPFIGSHRKLGLGAK